MYRPELVRQPVNTPTENKTEFQLWLDEYLSIEHEDERLYFMNEVFLLYLRLNNIHIVAKELGMSHMTVNATVKEYQDHLKTEYDKYCTH